MTWIRISVLVLLLAVVAGVTLIPDRGPGRPVSTEYGVTSQGRQFALRLDADGRPVAFETSLAAPCPSGRTVEMPWAPVDGDGVRFERRGDRLRLTERGESWRQVIDAEAGPGGRLTGTMTLVVNVRPETRPAYDCRSPEVRFSAGG